MPLGSNPQQMPKIVLDWKAYYEVFEQIHGTPVKFNGRFLYRDGWTHSMTDYAGPEWAPPDDEKEKALLIRAYYRRRVPQLREERDILKNQVLSIKEMQSHLSAPLQQRVRYYSEERGSYVIDNATVDTEPLEARIRNLEEEIRECESRLLTLEETKEKVA